MAAKKTINRKHKVSAAMPPGSTVRPVRLTISGGFRYAGAFVELQPFALSTSWKGKHDVVILPPTLDVEVHIFTPVPCKFELVVELNGTEKKDKGIVKSPGHHTQLFQFDLKEFGLGALKGPVA